MRIGEITKDNYADYMKLFGVKDSKALDAMWGKNKTAGKPQRGTTAYMESPEGQAELESIAVKAGYSEEGMLMPQGYEWEKHMLPVSDEVRNKLISALRRQDAELGDGTMNPDEISNIMKEYRKNVPPSDRLGVTGTMEKIVLDEGQRFISYVRANDPNWDWGKKINPDVLAAYVSGAGIDITA